MWSDTLPDPECRCRWVNRSENGGWDRTRKDPNCPIHRGT